jgi:hypothetical protein
MFFENRFGILYLFFLLSVVLAFIIRTALLIKSLPALDLTLWFLIKIYSVGFFYDVGTICHPRTMKIDNLLLPSFSKGG